MDEKKPLEGSPADDCGKDENKADQVTEKAEQPLANGAAPKPRFARKVNSSARARARRHAKRMR